VPEENKGEYIQLETGYEFPPKSFNLDAEAVSVYQKAVEDSSSLYHDTNLVPPLAVATFAMKILAEGLALLPGAIHVSQEFEFIDSVSVSEKLTSYAKVGRTRSRGGLHLMDVDLSVLNPDHKTVLTGKTSFVLPEQGGKR